jgi:hypothetical protein
MTGVIWGIIQVAVERRENKIVRLEIHPMCSANTDLV